MAAIFTITAIGRVSSSRSAPVDDNWDAERSFLELDATVLGSSAAAGIEDFSHIEVFYVFDKVKDEKVVTDARRPRGNPDWPKVGILAQRGKNRPNKIGATICEVLSVDGNTIQVHGLDAIDGTPIVDIKPVMLGFLPRTKVIEPNWAAEIMEYYWATS